MSVIFALVARQNLPAIAHFIHENPTAPLSFDEKGRTPVLVACQIDSETHHDADEQDSDGDAGDEEESPLDAYRQEHEANLVRVLCDWQPEQGLRLGLRRVTFILIRFPVDYFNS